MLRENTCGKMAVQFSEDVVLKVGAVLNDPTQPLSKRFRALFSLRNIEGEAAIKEISRCFADSSSLLKHELAYCLGQKQDKRAIQILVDVLKDTNQEAMVRHEAGEALGAIGDPSCIELLESYVEDPIPELSETCRLAIDRIRWNSERESDYEESTVYMSIDPAPSSVGGKLTEWERDLLDISLPLFKRYRALFSLRNRGGEEAVVSLAKGFSDASALFKHEIAYVLGQMQHSSAVEPLAAKLEDLSENPMVRHECAEALGSIATPRCLDVLKTHLQDKERVVRESCIVALDMYKCEQRNVFQYADTVSNVLANN